MTEESKRRRNRSGRQGDMIYLVPHTHYDAIWVFTKEDYFYINIDLILKKVLSLMEEDESYKFLVEQTYLLEELERRYPKLFRKLVKYVREGRIEIADGEYLMADTMLPQEETLIREIFFGKRYIREKFGVQPIVMWQADSFGLNAQLPQIYRKCGYKYLAFRRGCHEKSPSEFIWEDLSGTGIIAHFMPLGYRAALDLGDLESSYRELKRDAATNHILMPSGSGVTMPQEETTKAVEEWNGRSRAAMKIATPSEFFRAIEKDAGSLPVRRGEMFSGRFSEVFPDVASSRIWLKRGLRRYENMLQIFERFAAVRRMFQGDMTEEAQNCWRKILFLAFHDVIPGTGMDIGYEEAKQHIEFLGTELGYLTPRLLESVAELDSDESSEADIIVFNPLSWELKNWVEVDLSFDEREVRAIQGLRSGESETDVEIIKHSRYEDDHLRDVRIGFFANVPAMGYRTYTIVEDRISKRDRGTLKVSGNTISNPFFKVRVSPDSGLIKVLKSGRTICSTGNEMVVEEEIGDLYYHKETLGTPLKTEKGDGVKYGAFDVKNISVRRSPLRHVIDVDTHYYSLRWPYRLTDRLKPLIWRHRFMKFNKKMVMYRDIPRIDFVTTVENMHPRMRLRARFCTEVKNPECTCETQFGAVNRKTNQYYLKPRDWLEQPSGVFPSLRWIDYSDGEFGLTVMNRGNPESEVRDGDIYITLLRSVDMLSSDGTTGPAIPVPTAREVGTHVFEYSIYPHAGDWREAGSPEHGYEFNYGLIAQQLPKGPGRYREERSFLRIAPSNVILSALKSAEDGDGIIVRFYEALGRETKTSILLFRKPEQVSVVNMLEEKDEEFEKEITVKENSIYLTMRAFEVVTLRIR